MRARKLTKLDNIICVYFYIARVWYIQRLFPFAAAQQHETQEKNVYIKYVEKV